MARIAAAPSADRTTRGRFRSHRCAARRDLRHGGERDRPYSSACTAGNGFAHGGGVEGAHRKPRRLRVADQSLQCGADGGAAVGAVLETTEPVRFRTETNRPGTSIA